MCLPIQGYRIFQLKLGGDLNQNVDQIRACRNVMDSKDTLIGDANGGTDSTKINRPGQYIRMY